MSAGGRPQFRIFLQGFCAKEYLDLGSLADESSNDGWKQTYFFGTYNYDTGQATETIYLMAGVLAELELNCGENPWVRGLLSAKNCSSPKVNPGKAGRGVSFPGPYPFFGRPHA